MKSVITDTYNLLNEHIKLNIPIHPAGEWLLDNYYVVDETVKNIEKSLTLKKYRNFLGIANGTNCGFARIYVLANEIVSYTDNKIDGNVYVNNTGTIGTNIGVAKDCSTVRIEAAEDLRELIKANSRFIEILCKRIELLENKYWYSNILIELLH